MSKGDELKLEGGAAAKAERECGNDGGKNRIHPTTVWPRRKNLSAFPTFGVSTQGQATSVVVF
jgi:hypothetical protein